jgi:hypothetical protein
MGFSCDWYQDGTFLYSSSVTMLMYLKVIQAMQPWRHESMFADYIAEHSPMPNKSFMHGLSSPISQAARDEHLRTLSTIQASLQRLQPYLNRHDQEYKWSDQLRGYIDRLKASNPAQTAEEQFGQLYALRKWLFWVPISLLAAKRGDVTVMVVLAHFYATAVALEPMFRDIGSVFCANLSLSPLEEIVHIVQSYQDPRYDQRTQAISYLIQSPSEMASSYKTRREWARQQAGEHSPVQQPYNMEALNLDIDNQITQYSYGQSLSPAFAASPLTFVSPTLASGQTSPYLEIPRSSVDHGYVTSSYAAPIGIPATIHPPYPMPDEHVFSFGMPMGYPGGFVATPIWT